MRREKKREKKNAESYLKIFIAQSPWKAALSTFNLPGTSTTHHKSVKYFFLTFFRDLIVNRRMARARDWITAAADVYIYISTLLIGDEICMTVAQMSPGRHMMSDQFQVDNKRNSGNATRRDRSQLLRATEEWVCENRREKRAQSLIQICRYTTGSHKWDRWRFHFRSTCPCNGLQRAFVIAFIAQPPPRLKKDIEYH